MLRNGYQAVIIVPHPTFLLTGPISGARNRCATTGEGPMSRKTSDRSIPARGDEIARPPRRWGRRATAAAASITTALAITGAASAWALAATSPGLSWHFVKHLHSGGDFTAVVAVGKTGGWAFNGISKPTAWKRSGASWTQVSFPGQSGEEVVAPEASSATNVWAFTAGGSAGTALRWNGSHWSVKRSFAEQIGGAVVVSATDVWVFGALISPGSGLRSWHYNGQTCAKVPAGRRRHGRSGGAAAPPSGAGAGAAPPCSARRRNSTIPRWWASTPSRPAASTPLAAGTSKTRAGRRSSCTITGTRGPRWRRAPSASARRRCSRSPRAAIAARCAPSPP